MEGGTPEEKQAYQQKWVQWMGGIKEQGKLIAAQPLEKSGKVLHGKQKMITDGPFPEGKEIVGGYLLCKADDYHDALEISKGCPILDDDGLVEIREIREFRM